MTQKSPPLLVLLTNSPLHISSLQSLSVPENFLLPSKVFTKMSFISIRSASVPDSYLRLDGRKVPVTPPGKPPSEVGGTVDCQRDVGPLETLILHTNDDGTSSIQVNSLENIYLRMDAKGMKAHAANGAGIVNCQRGIGPLAKFRIEVQADGSKAIGSVASPGVYLRLDANGKPDSDGGMGIINCQWGITQTEKLLIVESDKTTALSHDEIETAVQTYAPILRLHPKEVYQNCSIEWFLEHCSLHDDKTKIDIPHPSVDQLPQGVQEDKRYWLILDPAAEGGDMSTAKAYVHAFWVPGMPYTDLQFWFFSAYNGHATAHVKGLEFTKTIHEGDIDLRPLGEHFGDWEYCIIRIDNLSKQMTNIGLSQHGADHFFNQSQFNAFQFQGTHPIVYSSLNGHANYPSVSSNPMADYKIPPVAIPAGIEFWLHNDTADGGPVLDCAQNYQVVMADWLTGSEAYPVPAWVNYDYRWGPEGTITHMDPDTVGNIVIAALGPVGIVVDGTLIQLLVGDVILPFFIKSNVNGSAAPLTQSSWNGNY